MENSKKNKTSKKSKKYKMSKKTWIILIIFAIIILGLFVFKIVHKDTEKSEKIKMEKLVSKWAEEYYVEEFANMASGYIKDKTSIGESISINLDALKKFGKDITIIKNSENGKKCDDINSYVSIKVNRQAKDISKEYQIEKVVLDCFE